MLALLMKSVRPIVRATAVFLLIAGLVYGASRAGAAAPPTSQPAPNAAAIAAALAAGKLSGLYVRQQMIPLFLGGRMTFNLRRDFFYFFPDGHMLFAVPAVAGQLSEHPTAADFAPFKDVSPDLRGTYVVKAGQITFTPAKGTPTTEPFSVPKSGDDSVLQIGPPSVIGAVKAVPFKDGEKLDASYQFDGTVGLGGDNTIFNVKTLTFRLDGSLVSDQLSGVDTKGIQTAVGSSGVTTHSNTTTPGTYRLNQYTLETTVGGKTEKATVFRWAGDNNAAAPGLICIAARVYSRVETKK